MKTQKKQKTIEFRETLAQLNIPVICQCCKADIGYTNNYAETEVGLWYNCDCGTTKLALPGTYNIVKGE